MSSSNTPAEPGNLSDLRDSDGVPQLVSQNEGLRVEKIGKRFKKRLQDSANLDYILSTSGLLRRRCQLRALSRGVELLICTREKNGSTTIYGDYLMLLLAVASGEGRVFYKQAIQAQLPTTSTELRRTAPTL